jgi:hypothetical protein
MSYYVGIKFRQPKQYLIQREGKEFIEGNGVTIVQMCVWSNFHEYHEIQFRELGNINNTITEAIWNWTVVLYCGFSAVNYNDKSEFVEL